MTNQKGIFRLTPRYEDLVDEPIQSLEEILSKIPTKALLVTISAISARLDEGDDQKAIMGFFFRRNHEKLKTVVPKITSFYKKNPGPISIFSKLYLNRLAIEALSNPNKNTNDTTPNEDWIIFKVYLIVVNNFLDQQELALKENYTKRAEPFNKLIWPVIAEQYQFISDKSNLFDLIRILVLVDELINENNVYVKSYSKQIGIPLLDYITNIDKIANHHEIIEVDGVKTPSFFIKVNKYQAFMFDGLSIDIDNAANEDNFNDNYLAIKKYPLLKHGEDTFVVINRDFLRNKIYTGFLFDFYNRSGIKAKYKCFPDFKSYIGKEISEKRLFRGLIQSIYSKKHHIVEFSDEDSHPDCYLRINNRIFLIEFKDYMMSSETITSYDAELFEEKIDLKFVQNQDNEPKGITQLTNQIQFLEDSEYHFDKLSLKGLNKGKLEVYPIVVFTDMQYAMPGVNSYLSDKFWAIYNDNGVFKNVFYPILLSMKFLVDNIQYIKGSRLDKVVAAYHKSIRQKEKLYRKNLIFSQWVQSKMSIDDLGVKVVTKNTSDKNVVEKFYEMLNLSNLK